MQSRLSLQEKVQSVLLYTKYQSFIEVRRMWKNFFTTKSPTNKTISNLVNKFVETGSVHDRQRSGRPSSAVTEQAIQNVTESLTELGYLSLRQGAQDLGMSLTSYYRTVIEAGFQAFRSTKVQELSDDDFDRRMEFCEIMLSKFDQNPRLLDMIIWTDESEFRLNGVINRHNCSYWAYSNEHEKILVSNSKQSLMVWCGMTSNGLIGPYFFDGSVTGESYHANVGGLCMAPSKTTSPVLSARWGTSSLFT